MYKVVFIRHGITPWAERFTGWTDIDVSPEGIEQTKQFAPRLKESGFQFDCAYTSYLKRSIRTLWAVLETIDQMYIPVTPAWQLNERHYGALQGLNKAETAAKYGEDQVRIWRRSFDVLPPALDPTDPRHPSHDPRYHNVSKELLPSHESLKENIARTVPYWQTEIVPRVKEGKGVLISAHGNSIRSLAKHIESISDEDIMKLDVPYSIPIVYEFDADIRFVRKYYLASDQEVEKVIQDIKNQGKAK